MAMCEKINTFKILKILLLSCLALLILQYIINIVVYNSKSNIFGLEVLFQQYATNKSRNETLKYRTTSRTDSPEVNIPSNTSVNNNTRTTAVSKTPLPLSTKIITTKIVSNITTTRPTTTTKKPEKNDTSTTLGITLPLCPMVPPDLVGQLATYTSAKTFDDIYKENSLLEPGGRYRPKDCVARHRVAIVIPYRNRENHLKIFLKNIHPILQRQQLDYGIYVIDMELPTKFNRAMLMNIGYNESLQIYDYQCFIFHDVDLIPENDKNIYSCPKNPRHMSVAIDKFKYKLPYASIFGGVSALTKDQMIKTNGFSNKFFGWGGEDDDMYSRIHNKGYKISRYSVEIARYKMIKHDRDSSNPLNKDRHKLIASGKSRQEKDGVNSLKYTVVKREFTPTYTYILTKIDEDQVMKS